MDSSIKHASGHRICRSHPPACSNAVFVDYSNLLYSAKDLAGPYAIPNLRALARGFPASSFVRVFHSEEPSFDRVVRKLGWCPLRTELQPIGANRVKGDCDVSIALAIGDVLHAHRQNGGNYEITLLSGDCDFLPAVRRAIAEGVSVTIRCFEASLHRSWRYEPKVRLAMLGTQHVTFPGEEKALGRESGAEAPGGPLPSLWNSFQAVTTK